MTERQRVFQSEHLFFPGDASSNIKCNNDQTKIVCKECKTIQHLSGNQVSIMTSCDKNNVRYCKRSWISNMLQNLKSWFEI